MVKTLITEDFSQKVLNSKKPILVDFWASWCGPCRMLAPVVGKISGEMADKYDFYKVNIDEENALAQQFGITNIPTLFVFKNGKAVEKLVGVRPEGEIISVLDKYAE